MTTIAVLGSGSWGTAVAMLLAQKPNHRVRLWAANPTTAAALLDRRENVRQLPGVPIPESIEITSEPADATRDAEVWFVAIPTKYLRRTLQLLAPHASVATPVVSLVKGLELSTFLRPTQIIADVLGTSRVAVLSGPSHAEEVARGLPTSLVAASTDAELASQVQRIAGGERMRVYTNDDLIGVELAGALKNVLGVAAGICDGLKYGDNSKAALLTRGLVEMQRFGVMNGASPETFFGMAGIGDLIATCFSQHGRNRRIGERLAQGETIDAIGDGPMVAEGVTTAKAVYERSQHVGLDMPILSGVYKVLYEGLSPLVAVQALLGRPQRCEKGKE